MRKLSLVVGKWERRDSNQPLLFFLPHRVAALEAERGNSLVGQWLGLCAFTAEGPGSIPAQGTNIPQAMWYGGKIKEVKKKLRDIINIMKFRE